MLKGRITHLRPLEKDDLDSLFKWKNDQEIFQYLGGGFQPTSKNALSKHLDNMMDMSGNNRRFIITEFDKNPIGLVGLYDINWIHRTCEIGMYLGEKDFHGRGFAKDACLVIEDYARKNLNLRKINLRVVSNNQHAIDLWKSLDYLEVGVYKSERFVNGHYYDLMIMEKFIETSSQSENYG